MQLDFIAGAYQLLEFQHFHPDEARRQVQQLPAQAQGPVDLHHAGQDRGGGKVAAEIRQVRRHDQLQAPLAVGLDLLQHVGRLRTRSYQQGFDLGLGQLALGVEGQLAQPAPAPWQGQCFAMPTQVATQRFGHGTPTLVAQCKEAGFAQDQQGAKGGTIFPYHAQPRFAHPVVGHQCLFQHWQGDALFFELDDAVQASEQFEAPIGVNSRRVGGMFHMGGRQIRRSDQQGAVAVLAQFDTGKGLPPFITLAPGDAAGFRTAEYFRRPLAQALLQASGGLGRQGAAGGKYPAHAAQGRPVEVVAHALE